MIRAFLGLVSIVVMASPAFADECLPLGAKGVSAKNFKVSLFEEDHKSCGLRRDTVFTLRKFNLNGVSSVLAVNPDTLESMVVKASCLRGCADISEHELSRTLYGDLLERGDDGHYSLQNDGVTEGRSDRYVALTIDMCPSSKGISQKVYDKLIERSNSKGKTIPIGVAMTAAWQSRHGERFRWIKKQVLKGKFKVQWINHSSTHVYRRGAPLKRNFMLSSGTNVESEVLGNEISMLRGGVTPSVFFRFPGLVSNRDLIQHLSGWGLIPLGSEAWLGKGEHAEEGDVILIHGNRNEPAGEKVFFRYLSNMDHQGHEFGSLYDVFFN